MKKNTSILLLTILLFITTVSIGGFLSGVFDKVKSTVITLVTEAGKSVTQFSIKSTISIALSKETKNTIKTQIDSIEKGLKTALEESNRIKKETERLATTKYLHEKITLLKNILGNENTQDKEGIKHLMSKVIYPILNVSSSVVCLYANKVSEYLFKASESVEIKLPDYLNKKSTIEFSNYLRKLTTDSNKEFTTCEEEKVKKGKNDKSINEYIDLLIKTVTHIENTLKASTWIKN